MEANERDPLLSQETTRTSWSDEFNGTLLRCRMADEDLLNSTTFKMILGYFDKNQNETDEQFKCAVLGFFGNTAQEYVNVRCSLFT
jgi:hypothetical protein